MKAPIPVTTSNAKLAGIVALSLSLSLFFFAPSLWQFSTPAPGSIVWARAITVLQQCEHPFRRDIEAAMQWRLLPPLVAHMLHLPGRTPLVLPWLGALIATAYVAVLFRRRCDDSRAILGGTLAFVSTSAVLVPFGLLGLTALLVLVLFTALVPPVAFVVRHPHHLVVIPALAMEQDVGGYSYPSYQLPYHPTTTRTTITL